MKSFLFSGMFFLLVSMSCLNISQAQEALPVPVGKVVWIKGTLKAIMPNKEERKLQKSSVIYLNDTLMTDTESQAQVIFTDHSLMTFRAETQFYIDQYQYQPKAKKGSVGKYVMKLIEGGFRTITGLIAKNNPNDYQVNTPVATIGVRGTDYTVYVRGKEVFVGFYEGTPCVKNAAGSLCLDNKDKYARVSSASLAPVPLTQQPAVFKEKLEIVPAKITPFTTEGASGGTTGGTTGSTPPNRGGSGTVSNFCIT